MNHYLTLAEKRAELAAEAGYEYERERAGWFTLWLRGRTGDFYRVFGGTEQECQEQKAGFERFVGQELRIIQVDTCVCDIAAEEEACDACDHEPPSFEPEVEPYQDPDEAYEMWRDQKLEDREFDRY